MIRPKSDVLKSHEIPIMWQFQKQDIEADNQFSERYNKKYQDSLIANSSPVFGYRFQLNPLKKDT